ncbi:MAG: hypothetical protein Q9M76_02675 [Candidatus Dojkabacteria bacterium]|nr:hypothetical protein [Candidatus Dojkabacteria bacterium]
MYNRSTVEAILDEEMPILNIIDKNEYVDLLKSHIPYYFSQVYFMQDDPLVIRTIEFINRNEIAKNIWENLTLQDAIDYNPKENRLVHFKISGISVPMYFSRETLQKNSRFEIIEYQPKGNFLKILSKLI